MNLCINIILGKMPERAKVTSRPVKTSAQLVLPKPGERITIRGRTFVVLGMEQGGVLAITERPICEKPFDEDGGNDWRKSSLRAFLNGDEGPNMVPKEMLLPFTSDLTADDGQTDYGASEDYAFLLSADLYRKYREYIPKMDRWWWLLTPWSTLPSNAYLVRSVHAVWSPSRDLASWALGVVAGLLFNPESLREQRSNAAALCRAEDDE